MTNYLECLTIKKILEAVLEIGINKSISYRIKYYIERNFQRITCDFTDYREIRHQGVGNKNKLLHKIVILCNNLKI